VGNVKKCWPSFIEDIKAVLEIDPSRVKMLVNHVEQGKAYFTAKEIYDILTEL